jgi:hypothetical protein
MKILQEQLQNAINVLQIILLRPKVMSQVANPIQQAALEMEQPLEPIQAILGLFL